MSNKKAGGISCVCDKCDNSFVIRSVDIKDEEVTIEGEHYVLTFFVCPECFMLYRIALKDVHYYELFEDLESMKKRIKMNKGTRKNVTASVLNTSMLRKTQRLQNHMDFLKNKFNGTFTRLSPEQKQSDDNKIIYHE